MVDADNANEEASGGEEIDDEGHAPIRGKVARILNIRDLVLNRGTDHSVYVGMEFVILNRNAQNIVDPETSKVIGSVPIAKTIVKVVSVQDELAIARTFRQSKGNSLAALAIFAGGPREETLRTKESTAQQELDEKDSYVKTGDDAVEVQDGDEYLLPPI